MSNLVFYGIKSTTAIDNDFIDNYMGKAPNLLFSVIYIYGYRCCAAGISVSNSDIAEKFGVLESDVINAWKYWRKVGLIKISGTKEEPTIEFIEKSESIHTEAAATKEEEQPKIVMVRPTYTPVEVKKIINEDERIFAILNIAEGEKGRPITQKEQEIIVWMYHDLELPEDVICMLTSFCYKNNKGANYIEKTAIDWIEKGINTDEKAAAYLSFFDNYGKVLKMFGVTDRIAVKREQDFIDCWLKDWSMPMELVECAVSKTLERTGKVAFKYCNRILEDWHKKGYKTVDEVEKASKEFVSQKSSQKPKSAFNSYDYKIYSDDEIKDILRRKEISRNEQ